jgi:saccharopine dehydrogenase-like NADP-dependent oxidoreductase
VSTVNLRKQVARYLKMEETANAFDRMEWLGLFSGDVLPISGRETTRLDILAARMAEKMTYQPGERDMLVLMHQFIARFPGKPDEHISSTMIDFGLPDGDTSMARTVSLPAAIGVKMILTGQIAETGVHVPVSPTIYNPVLDELATMNIRCVEKSAPAG